MPEVVDDERSEVRRSPRASVIVPAHDEESAISATLRTLLADADPGEFEVVVVCNGCSDRTAEIAREVAGVHVVEIPEASKIAALREGDRQSDVFPRIYLDGDVELTTAAARALVEKLEAGALVAGVPGQLDLRGVSAPASLFFEFRQLLPVFAGGIIGAGVYAMSREGRERFGVWPEVLGDDQFVLRSFAAEERAVVDHHRTTVRPVRTLREVVRRGVRVRRGNAQLDSLLGGTGHAPPSGFKRALARSSTSPRRMVAAAVFMVVSAAIRSAARAPGRHGDWQRSGRVSSEPETRGRVGVLFAEALAAPEAVWSLRDAGFDVLLIRRADTRPSSATIRGIARRRICSPERSFSCCERDLRVLVRRERLDGLLPLDDVAMLLASRLSDDACRVVGPDRERTTLALDKAVQVNAARAAGFSVPEGEVYVDPARLRWSGSYPVVLKPADAVTIDRDRVTKGPSWVCADASELEEAIAHVPRGQRYFIQQHVTGTGCGAFGIATGDGVVAWSGHQRVRMMNPAGSGSSACEPHVLPTEVLGAVERFLRSAEWRGPFMVELLRDAAGDYWFMELNGRLWGSLALARRQGLEYPAWAVSMALDPTLEPHEPPARRPVALCRNLPNELLHLVFVARGARTRAPITWPTLPAAALAVSRLRRSDRWYNWRRDEPWVLLYDTIWRLSKAVRGSRR